MTQSSTDRQSGGILLALASAVAFAVGPTAAKVAFDHGSTALTVVTLRGVVGAALMAALIPIARQRFAIDREALRRCLYCGFFYSLVVYGFIASVATLPVAVAVLVFFTHPLLIAVMAHWRGGERLTAPKLFLACAALAGVALVLGPELDALDPVGIALAALASVAMCGMILSSARAQERATSIQVNLYATAASSVAFACVTTALGGWALPTDRVGWIGIAAAGIGIGVGLLTLFAALRRLSPVRATMLTNVEPLLAFLFAAVILGEGLDPLRWAGVALVVAALVLFEAAGHERRAHVETFSP